MRVKAVVDISFGLGMALLAIEIGNSFTFAKEILMNNANAFMACVWCGVAFLRGPGGNASIQTRGTVADETRASQEERRRFDSFSPHHLFLV